MDSRGSILLRAAEIASIEGLEGVTIGRLAVELGMSKSGVFSHFGAKEELQLATVQAAAEIFSREVVVAGGPLLDLCGRWLDYSKRRVFPGGCFFVVTRSEFAARPGRVRDALMLFTLRWVALLERLCGDAQLAFEVDALLVAADRFAVLYDDASAYERVRLALRARIAMPTGIEMSVATPNDSSIASQASSTI
ncbi:TetR/AcrR family transcriptional regulator [Lentzea flava]|uniref:TetR/AcrR family transcriptional regulator n=1 Tax=Lentzea flava TaxID=103732 RepID=UPI00166FBB0A|nr:TetR/AcrR family transcriptional regulator [Lentzea flava]MCP2201333.1 transcriptional regulator, TetR family [Lentzea flava]